MKIATFNIRCDYGQDGPNNFSCRQPLILRRLAAEQPDIIGFQEVLPHVQRWLRTALPGYTVLGCGRSRDYADEAVTLAVRNDTAEILSLDTFWLSPTPRLPGSRYPVQSICPRTCAAAVIYLREWETPIRVYNTHLDHEGAPAREQGLRQILARIRRDRAELPMPAVLMGDFNATPGAPELAPLREPSSFPLRDITADIPLSFHNFGLGQEPSGKIDYLFAGGGLRPERVRCWTDEENGVFLSDHYPICAELQRGES